MNEIAVNRSYERGYQDGLAAARLVPAEDEGRLLQRAAALVVTRYDKTHLTHDVAYEDVAEAIDWLRVALDPSHPLYAALAATPEPK